jgi:hypothetical protein
LPEGTEADAAAATKVTDAWDQLDGPANGGQ